MKNSTIRRVIILGAIAIIGILGIQTYWVLQTLDIKEKEFNQTASTALIEVARKLARINGSVLPNQNLVTQRTSNYFIVNINEEIDANLLEHYLKTEFEERALKTDFEYGIYNCSSDQMVYGELISFSKESLDEIPREDLPKYADLDYYFGVRFPKRVSFLLASMNLVVIFSVILFLTIAFFMYSMLVILRQRRLSEMQTDFINNMTHEFKTPISTIKISADVFENSDLIREDPRLKRYAGIITEQNQRLNEQVEKVLQIARIERDTIQLNLEEVNLNDLLQDVIRNAEPKLEKLGGELTLHLPTKQIQIEADRTHLLNIFFNLIDNAMKYSPGEPKIDISLNEEEKLFKVSIKDEGPGIPEEYQERVFEKFFRIPTGNVHDVKGFGLGLFYIKSICKAHGWKVALESKEGKGTEISISMKKPTVERSWSFFNWLKPLQFNQSS
ncbi:MAG: HAMP domain-containing histidine kinase [Saprospiraceae bacterium]|nr:HAMP domain-containing histidine kinase [Saprospiraceae bacterium]